MLHKNQKHLAFAGLEVMRDVVIKLKGDIDKKAGKLEFQIL